MFIPSFAAFIPLFSSFDSIVQIVNFQIRYASVLFSGFGFIHWGLACGAYGKIIVLNFNISGQNIRGPGFDPMKSNKNRNVLQEALKAKTPEAKSEILDTSKFAVDTKIGWQRMLWGALPAAISIGALNMYPLDASIILGVGYILMMMYDFQCSRTGLAPNWFGIFKFWVTIVILMSMATAVWFGWVYQKATSKDKRIL